MNTEREKRVGVNGADVEHRGAASHADAAWSWSSSRAGLYAEEKRAMAEAFVMHDFLADQNGDPEQDVRETAASILVNAGTSPQAAVAAALDWMKDQGARTSNKRQFAVRWCTGGALVSGMLLDFRAEHRELWSLAELFLFPGPVVADIESVCGENAARYVTNYFKWNITCSILSCHSFDMVTGDACFYFPYEISFQRACALYPARDKILFLDPSKFRRKDGGCAYAVKELLLDCRNLTIYTVASQHDQQIVRDFKQLGAGLLETPAVNGDEKTFRLCIVGTERGRAQRHVLKGSLRDADKIRQLLNEQRA